MKIVKQKENKRKERFDKNEQICLEHMQKNQENFEQLLKKYQNQEKKYKTI